MASVKKVVDKSGVVRYRARCCVGRDAFGRQIWRSTTIASPGLTPVKEKNAVAEAASKWEQEQKDAYKVDKEKAPPVDKGGTSFRIFVNEHWFPVAVDDGMHTPDTVAFYRNMSALLTDYFHDMPLNRIGLEQLKLFLKYLRTEAKTRAGKPLSASSIKHYYDVLRVVLMYAERDGWIEMQNNPFRRMQKTASPRVPKKPQAWINHDMEPAFNAAFEAIKDTSPMWYAYYKLSVFTGLRRGEMVALRWCDIDFAGGWLTVQNNATRAAKGSAERVHIGAPKDRGDTEERRKIPLVEALTMLQHWKEQQAAMFGGAELLPTAYVFARGCPNYCDHDRAGNPNFLPGEYAFQSLYPTTPTAWFADFEKRHGLPSISPHDLRHTFATRLDRTGASPRTKQTILGHTSYSTSFDYTGTDEHSLREAMENVTG